MCETQGNVSCPLDEPFAVDRAAGPPFAEVVIEAEVRGCLRARSGGVFLVLGRFEDVDDRVENTGFLLGIFLGFVDVFLIGVVGAVENIIFVEETLASAVVDVETSLAKDIFALLTSIDTGSAALDTLRGVKGIVIEFHLLCILICQEGGFCGEAGCQRCVIGHSSLFHCVLFGLLNRSESVVTTRCSHCGETVKEIMGVKDDHK